jgi:hypothetical protein
MRKYQVKSIILILRMAQETDRILYFLYIVVFSNVLMELHNGLSIFLKINQTISTVSCSDFGKKGIIF